MVVNTRDAEKMGFALRLAAACEECPDCREARSRVSWLRHQFNPALSDQAVRKWFNGEVIPDQANIARLASVLGVNAQWLQAGGSDAVVKSPPDDARLKNLIRAWPEIGEDMKTRIGHLAELALPLPDKNN